MLKQKDHPNIFQYLDHFPFDYYVAIVIELIKVKSLRERINEKGQKRIF
jgi:serine/threonine protein kinase